MKTGTPAQHPLPYRPNALTFAIGVAAFIAHCPSHAQHASSNTSALGHGSVPQKMTSLASTSPATTTALSTRTRSTTTADAAAQAATQPPAAAYRDRLIGADSLPPLPLDGDEEFASSGSPRGLHVEALAFSTHSAQRQNMEWGVAFGGYWETSDHGTLNAEGVIARSDPMRQDGSAVRGKFTLWQRGLPMPGQWTVDNALGIFNTTMPDLLRDQYRFVMPSVTVAGISTDWRRRHDNSRLQAAVGRVGTQQGARLNGFEMGDTGVLTTGAQWSWSPHMISAASLLLTDGRMQVGTQPSAITRNDTATQSLFTAHRWSGPRDTYQFNALLYRAGDTHRNGFWLDAKSQRGAFVHRYGAFSLPPALAWGVLPINNDIHGGYYRVDFRRARWNWNLGIERVASISGKGSDGWYSYGSFRHQATRTIGYGSSFGTRRSTRNGSEDHAYTLQLFVDANSHWGQTRLQYEMAHATSGDDSWQLTVDHALRMREGARLSLAAGVGVMHYDFVHASRTTTLAAYGGFDLTDALSLNGSVRWTDHRDGTNGGNLDANVGLRWELSSRWTMTATWIESRASRRSPFVLSPLAQPPVTAPLLQTERSVFVGVRYDFQAGRTARVLGGPPNSATGQITGSLFLDENGDGLRGATEQPAVDVTVLLDDRIAVQTDAQGRFRFDRVAVGTHQLTIVPDNLPLPWSIDDERLIQRVDVEVRRNVVVEIGAKQPR